jgi:hypothetical protein
VGRWQLAFAVSDTGPGIAAADQERIFEPFVQAGQGGAAEGTGLGLAISREFVHMMGGMLTVQSAPGEGAEFRFAVPAGVAAAMNPGAGPAGDAAPAPGGELPCVAGGTPPPLTAEALAALPPGSAAGLCAAVQELNLARAARLLAALPPACAGTAVAIARMLSLYHYPQLCAMLAPAQEHEHEHEHEHRGGQAMDSGPGSRPCR